MPDNSSLAALVGSGSPLLRRGSKPLAISFYGDSITWLGLYEGVIASALKSSPFTNHLNVTLINQVS